MANFFFVDTRSEVESIRERYESIGYDVTSCVNEDDYVNHNSIYVVMTVKRADTLARKNRNLGRAMSETEKTPELQQRLMDAGLGLVEEDFDYRGSDLHVVALPGVRKWLETWYKHFSLVTGFRALDDADWRGSDWNGAGEYCFNIPFAGDWDRG